MADDLHYLDELLAEIEKTSISTSAGSFVKVEELKKLIDKRRTATTISKATEFKGRSFADAAAAVKKDPEIMKNFKDPSLREPGRAITAGE